jgi:hypothetical protein
MILFMSLQQVAMVASLVVLIIQGVTHVAHLLKIKETGANLWIVLCAIIAMFGIAALTLWYTSQKMPEIGYYLLTAFAIAFALEIALRLVNNRTISKQTSLLTELKHKVEEIV